MIIKSMARKTASFGQLAKYMEDGASNTNIKYGVFYKNIYSKQRAGVTKEFRENAKNLQKRKNGNYLYHEVISITKSKEIPINKQKEILYKLVSDYVELRAKNNLVYGYLHDEKEDNLHFHLMISANEIGSHTRHRLDKKTYGNIQKQIEKHVLNEYPELAQQIIYNQKKNEKTTNKEYELKKRTGKKSVRDHVKDDLTNIFSSSSYKDELFNKLSENGFELYVRGKTIGVKKTATGKKYRLKTLGLLDDFNKLSAIIETPESKKPPTENKQKPQEKEHKKPKYTTDKVSTKVTKNKKNETVSKKKEPKEPTKKDKKKQETKEAWEEVLNSPTEAEDDWNRAKRVAEEKAEFEYKKSLNEQNREKNYKEKGEKIRKYKEEARYKEEQKKKKESEKLTEENLKYLDELNKLAAENEKIKAKLKKNRENRSKENEKNRSR